MTDFDYQVIVVGAGPAGSVTALLLARHGLNVALLDRRIFPRPKPCGECLSAQATRVLERLGLLESVLAQGPAQLEGWRIVAPSGHAFEARFPPGEAGPTKALAMDRRSLDATLVRAATGAGATLRHLTVRDVLRERGRVVGVEGRGPDGTPERMRGRLVVGADGLHSAVARRLGLVRRPLRLEGGRRKLSLTTHVMNPGGDWPSSPGLGEMHLAPETCLGVAPVDSAGLRLNLSLVVSQAWAVRGVDAERFFLTRLQEFPALKGRLGGLRVEEELLASGPFRVPTRDVVADGAALVGDAAGYFDPFTGQGIFRALAGAEILAPVAAAALAKGRADVGSLRPYARRHRAMVTWPRRLQRLIDAVVTRPDLADAAVTRLGGAPELAQALVAVTGDMRPVGTLLAPRLLLSLFAREHPS